MHSIKTKLILGISVLLLFLFGVTAVLLVKEKKDELALDVYHNARAFAELTTPKIVDLNRTLLAEDSFVLFNREMNDVFNKNRDVSSIELVTYGADVLYNSEQEKDRAYEGKKRNIETSTLVERVRTSAPSIKLNSGRIVFLKKNSDGLYFTVDKNEATVSDISPQERIVDIIVPYAGTHAVIYKVSYSELQSRVNHMTTRILLLLIFGLLLGLGAAMYVSGKMTKPIETLKEGAEHLGKGEFSTRLKIETQDEIGMLAETFNSMAANLEVSTKAMIEKDRLTKELELAAKIQRQILPKQLPEIPDLEFATALIPANQVGGDCYDFIKVDDDTTLIYLSDVTGHGVPAGLVVSIASALIASYANEKTMCELLTHTNKMMKQKTAQNMFMTLLMIRYSKGQLSYVSAGHPELLHYYAKEKKVVTENGGGIALGMVPDISKLIKEVTIPFNSGDCVVLYSDGIPEGVNERGEMYGMPRFKRALQDAGEIESVLAVKNALIADAKLFMGKAEQLDDITMVVVRKK